MDGRPSIQQSTDSVNGQRLCLNVSLALVCWSQSSLVTNSWALDVDSSVVVDAVPPSSPQPQRDMRRAVAATARRCIVTGPLIAAVCPVWRSEEHTSELQSLLRS